MPKKNTLPQKIAHVLSVYVKTQFVLIILVAFISWGMLSLLGVEYALLLSVLTGSASIVPILGIVLTSLIASIVAIFDATRFVPHLPVIVEGLVVLVLYGVLNVIVDYVLSPYIIGKSTKVNPFLILLAVLAGALLFGFVGALLAVPALLVIKTIIEHQDRGSSRLSE